MILISDGGSTKANWCLVKPNGEMENFTTEGYNPHYVDDNYIVDSLEKTLPAFIERDKITEVNFYGSGCMAGKAIVMANALHKVFPEAKVNAEVDLLAAARALLGKKPGFAAILGTGTNTCIYDGNRITQNIDSLGYMLGDEGSGSYIGKKLLQDYLRSYMPEPVSQKFGNKIGLSFDEIFDRIYSQPLPNRYCSELAKFAAENIDDPYIHDLVKECFSDFFTALVCHYPRYRDYTFNCIGSVGFYYKNLLCEVASDFGMEMGKIMQTSMEGLIAYHLNEKNNWL